MLNTRHISAALFFTRGVSLRTWDEAGLLGREVSLYRRLVERGVDVSFITHGDARDLALAERIPEIRILCNRWNLPGRIHRPLIPWLHRSSLRRADLIKTNQMHGAEIALHAARRFGKPLIARCGYMLSEFVAQQEGENAARVRWALELERRVFLGASQVVVTTDAMRADALRRFPDLCDRVTVVPNYVDTDLFSPPPTAPEGPPRLCFVGRLAPQKNIAALISAVNGLDVDLDIIGDGPLHGVLENITQSNPRIHFVGSVPSDDLPSHLQRATAFALPSLYEGHPKTLIEAMACGLPVIATDVPGIREVLTHGETGILCQTDPESLRDGISKVLGNATLRESLGRRARELALERFSLDRVVECELRLYHDVLERHRRS